MLSQFGVETTSLIALVGAAGLAIGLALQGTLSNLAAGVMLLIFRPFKVGDYVTAGGHSGTVEEISLFTTHVVSTDNVLTIVPNGDIWASAVTNYSVKDTRRLDLVFGVSYGTDLKSAEQALRATSSSEIAGGAVESPTKPVIFGVPLTTCQVSSFRSIRTRM